MSTVLVSPTKGKAHPPPVDPHGFESVRSILQRIRFRLENQMTDTFSEELSIQIDVTLDLEERAR